MEGKGADVIFAIDKPLSRSAVGGDAGPQGALARDALGAALICEKKQKLRPNKYFT